MRTDMVLMIACVFAAIFGVKHLEKMDRAGFGQPASAARAGAATPASAPQWAREVRIFADRDQQFRVDAGVNRAGTHFLIDTGAALVALRKSDAARARIHTYPEDFTAPVSTANGVTYAAKVQIEEIEIHGLRVYDVEAWVLPDELLEMNLLGMTFLSKLPSVETRGAEMILRG